MRETAHAPVFLPGDEDEGSLQRQWMACLEEDVSRQQSKDSSESAKID